MRAVFVNHCHPQMDHVCALRLPRFAEALAERGHHIVVLSGSLSGGDGDISISDHRRALVSYDWAKPYVLPCHSMSAPLLERLHEGRLPGGLRQAVVAAGYLFRGGVFGHWRQGAGAAISMLAEQFTPDVVWATFGNTDAWNIGQSLARRAGCPWVADLKDNWDHYIPAPFRRPLTWRYGDAAYFTALSKGHADMLSRRFGASAKVIYSGFDSPKQVGPRSKQAIRIVVAGSIYDGQALRTMLDGIEAWLNLSPTGLAVEVCYFGNDHRQAGDLLAPLGGRCRVVVKPWLEPAELRPILDTATVILFPRHPPMLFHHKFADYLSTGRPVICLPGETAECANIAEDIKAPLFSCDSVKDVTVAMVAIVAGHYPAIDENRLAAYGWPQQAMALEAVFEDIIRS